MTIWPILALSLLGSPHCAAMCGLIAGAATPTPKAAMWYHGSRLLGYMAVGAIAGSIGRGADQIGSALGWQALATRGAGIALMAVGVVGALRALGLARIAPIDGHRWVAGLAGRTRSLSPSTRAGALGALTALLPCGWLLAFVIAAAGTGGAVDGALAMATFWLGTVPALVAAGLVVRRAAGPLRRRLPLIAALLLIAFGAFTTLHRSAVPLAATANHVSHAR